MGTVPKAVKYGAALIGVYLVVVYATGASKVTSAGATGLSGVIANLQGRAHGQGTPAAAMG